jgi:hypothetical protein
MVGDACLALVTEAEVRAVTETRRQSPARRLGTGYSRSRTSEYLLSGGLFVCGRCGANTIGVRKSGDRHHWVCGSQPYRRRMGCGTGVYVPKERVEREVMDGLSCLMAGCADPREFARLVNEGLLRVWTQATGYDPGLNSRAEAIDDGVADAGWANERLRALGAERTTLTSRAPVVGRPTQISAEEARACRWQSDRPLSGGRSAGRGALIPNRLPRIKLVPEELVVERTYRLPEPVWCIMVARAGFEPATSRL